MHDETQHREERQGDDRWTGPRLVVLAFATLAVAIGIIYTLASHAAPY